MSFCDKKLAGFATNVLFCVISKSHKKLFDFFVFYDLKNP